MSNSSQGSIRDWIMVPAIISLGVTLLRLMGELMNWSVSLFNPEAGGGGAPIGISWLVPIFGFWFAWRLAKQGRGPKSLLATMGAGLGGFVLIMVAGFLAQSLSSVSGILLVCAVSLVSFWIARQPWKELGRILTAYGLAARIPVAIVMLVAILGDWGTHYDVVPPDYTGPTGAFLKWVLIGLLPQLTIWMSFTLTVGVFFGGIAAAIGGRK